MTTMNKVLETLSRLKPNTVKDEDISRWLLEIDGQLFKELYMTEDTVHPQKWPEDGDVEFAEYKVCVVSANSSTQEAGTTIPTVGGSINTSGDSGNYPAATNIQVTITGADLESASSGDGAKIIKVFVKNAAGTWSVA